MKRLFPAVLLAASFCLPALRGAESSPSYFASWPAGTSPLTVGKRVAKHFLATPHPQYGSDPVEMIYYPEVITWYGALTFSKLAGDRKLTRDLIARFQPLFGKEAKLVPKADHVDSTVFGSVPLEIYLQTGDKKYLELGRNLAEEQWAPPQGTKMKPKARNFLSEGLSWHTRFWIDDMYMITAVQTQAYRATGDPVYLDRAAREMAAYLDELQQPNGLFFHAPTAPFFWGRGNGWVAAGMTELLRSLPADHPQRPKIMAGYRRMMARLLKTQDQAGMWHQLVDDPNSWPETSCTGMFTFAFITGVKNGWLDAKTYGPAARKGWLALVGYINAKADVTEVCEGTGRKNDRQFYLTRARKVGDMHGQGPVLWCASALLR